MEKRKKVIKFCTACLLLIFTIWILSAPLKVSRCTVSNKSIPEKLDGLTIAQISDLHNQSFGKNNKRLIRKLRKNNPDIIVVTGDLAGSSGSDNAVALIEQVSKIAPTYYVPGNHESYLTNYTDLESDIRRTGAIVLRNETVYYQYNNQPFAITGIDDPQFFSATTEPEQSVDMQSALFFLSDNTVPYQILLSHRPEYFDSYCQNGYDLIFCGHAHGGQVRLPFIGGLYAPNQGFNPKYDAGIYTENETTMVVSRGLGNSVAFPRIFNRPQLVIVQLKCEK